MVDKVVLLLVLVQMDCTPACLLIGFGALMDVPSLVKATIDWLLNL